MKTHYFFKILVVFSVLQFGQYLLISCGSKPAEYAVDTLSTMPAPPPVPPITLDTINVGASTETSKMMRKPPANWKGDISASIKENPINLSLPKTTLQEGAISYVIADSMFIGQTYTVVAAIGISKSETHNNANNIHFRLSNNEATPKKVKENPIDDIIQIGSVMSMELLDASILGKKIADTSQNFNITKLFKSSQKVSLTGDSSSTNWKWEVTPLKSGKHPLLFEAFIINPLNNDTLNSNNAVVYKTTIKINNLPLPWYDEIKKWFTELDSVVKLIYSSSTVVVLGLIYKFFTRNKTSSNV